MAGLEMRGEMDLEPLLSARVRANPIRRKAANDRYATLAEAAKRASSFWEWA
jgi:hypothetical protein